MPSPQNTRCYPLWALTAKWSLFLAETAEGTRWAATDRGGGTRAAASRLSSPPAELQALVYKAAGTLLWWALSPLAGAHLGVSTAILHRIVWAAHPTACPNGDCANHLQST